VTFSFFLFHHPVSQWLAQVRLRAKAQRQKEMGERRKDVEITKKRMNLPGFGVLSPFSFLLYSFAFLFRFALRYFAAVPKIRNSKCRPKLVPRCIPTGQLTTY
jgi:hypothetical protein